MMMMMMQQQQQHQYQHQYQQAEPGAGRLDHNVQTKLDKVLLSNLEEEPIQNLRELYRVPAHASWYRPNEIHEIEKRYLPEFFNGKSANKTPRLYKQVGLNPTEPNRVVWEEWTRVIYDMLMSLSTRERFSSRPGNFSFPSFAKTPARPSPSPSAAAT